MKRERPSPSPMDHKPTVEELEAILNSDTTDEIYINPDESVFCTPQKPATVGDVADAVMKITNAEIDKLAATVEQFRGANSIQIELRQAADEQHARDLLAALDRVKVLEAEVEKSGNALVDAAERTWRLLNRAVIAEAQLATLRQLAEPALKFYRDGWVYEVDHKRAGLSWHPREGLLDDCGNRASEALNAICAAFPASAPKGEER